MGDLGPTELRLMQGLAQQVTALRPELVNGDATVGELAWVWAKDFDALNQFWRHRLWFVDGRLAAWAWVYLPYRVPRSDAYPSSFTEAAFERVRRTWPYRADLHVLIEAPDGTASAFAS